jgi:glycosyltransferase involved in cell wall biosynthesis
VIPYGLDTSAFRPRETEGLRQTLGIPADHRIVLFVAQSTHNRRKGFDLLVEALGALAHEKVALVSIGSRAPDLEVAGLHVHLGSLSSDLLLSVFYALADVFVVPSRQDNLPNTVLEAMACGTPVVGFDAGGIPDMVRPGETGWLAEADNPRALRDAIDEALRSDAERERRGQRSRAVVEAEYALDLQARRYHDLYRTLVPRVPHAG